jgi:hypothetical protein
MIYFNMFKFITLLLLSAACNAKLYSQPGGGDRKEYKSFVKFHIKGKVWLESRWENISGMPVYSRYPNMGDSSTTPFIAIEKNILKNFKFKFKSDIITTLNCTVSDSTFLLILSDTNKENKMLLFINLLNSRLLNECHFRLAYKKGCYIASFNPDEGKIDEIQELKILKKVKNRVYLKVLELIKK